MAKGVCPDCTQDFSPDNCNPSVFSRGYGRCRPCDNLRRKEQKKLWPFERRAEAFKKRAAYNRKKYCGGVTQEEFDAKLISQCGRCEICKNIMVGVSGACQDHDHATGKPRDLLCSKCNKFLGGCSDSIEILLSAVRYLRKHAENRGPDGLDDHRPV